MILSVTYTYPTFMQPALNPQGVTDREPKQTLTMSRHSLRSMFVQHLSVAFAHAINYRSPPNRSAIFPPLSGSPCPRAVRISRFCTGHPRRKLSWRNFPAAPAPTSRYTATSCGRRRRQTVIRGDYTSWNQKMCSLHIEALQMSLYRFDLWRIQDV